jgi:hypothetical protein
LFKLNILDLAQDEGGIVEHDSGEWERKMDIQMTRLVVLYGGELNNNGGPRSAGISEHQMILSPGVPENGS